ncbi:MAG: PEP-CTERM sorting domain-containing protein [Gammaproteobacteria bacterium]|nr:MAG: PEP-CTERM sorting domain-containing protein [Gammaproteobacteria bacterium]
MFSLVRFSAFILLLISTAAYSVPYTFEYSTHLTSSLQAIDKETVNYELGDSFKSFVKDSVGISVGNINTASSDYPYASDYPASNKGSDFLTGQLNSQESYASSPTDAYAAEAAIQNLADRSDIHNQFVKLVAVNVPEPNTLFLPAIGLLALLLGRRLKTL